MNGKPRWYHCSTTPEGRQRFKVSFCYVRISYQPGMVLVYSETKIGHITKEQAARCFTIITVGTMRLQHVIENRWDALRNK